MAPALFFRVTDRVVETWTKIALKDVRVDEPISDEQFDTEALGLAKDKPDITVMRTTVNGRMIPYVYREGSSFQETD